MPDPMTDERLDEIEKRANAAKAGPWRKGGQRYRNGQTGRSGACFWLENNIGTPLRFDTESDPTHAEANADFTAHARTDIPDLIAEVRRLRAENGQLCLSPPAAEMVSGLSAFAEHLESGGTVDSWPGTHTRKENDDARD